MSVLLRQKHSFWSLVLNIQHVASWREFNLSSAEKRREMQFVTVVLATDARNATSCDS